ncbi:hypothetical protein COLO4_24033 [Corchorus olitorius]|uniref:CCHC-type domain-containing protein n=1 Tax=Corchorus olitorius TaxID=93759 RepID=A0A1R3IDC7_9ROSI|nr:hypothetical protein COLO4_24033 [Corchorus olitorius]
MEFQGGSGEEVEIELVAAGEEVGVATRFALLGKIVVNRDLNRKGVINVLRSIWNARDLVDVRDLGNNVYGISFANEKGMMFALENGPWSVLGHSLVLRRWEVSQTIREVTFDTLQFWIQVHNLPLEMQTKMNANRIGSVVGKVCEIEDPSWTLGVGRGFFRIKVEIDVKKPLLNGFWVPCDNKDRLWAEILYERPVDFCYHCGRLGHIEKNCEYGESHDRIKKYGAWMRVGPARDKGRGDGVWKRWDEKGSPMLQADFDREKIAEKAAWGVGIASGSMVSEAMENRKDTTTCTVVELEQGCVNTKMTLNPKSQKTDEYVFRIYNEEEVEVSQEGSWDVATLQQAISPVLSQNVTKVRRKRTTKSNVKFQKTRKKKGVVVNKENLIQRIKKAAAESMALIEVEKNSYKIRKVENMVWEKPDEDWCKVNCDAAFDNKAKEACLGVVIRNADAEVVGGTAVKKAADSCLIAEGYAVREGLKEARRMKIPKIIVESDSQTLVNCILASGEGRWEIEPIVADIRAFMKIFEDSNIKWITRSANKAADWLSQQLKRGLSISNWVNCPPTSLVNILSRDGLPAPPFS